MELILSHCDVMYLHQSTLMANYWLDQQGCLSWQQPASTTKFIAIQELTKRSTMEQV